MFKMYSNFISQASKHLAIGAFVVGMSLIGIGVIIWALPKVFAGIAALVFCFSGIGCIVSAVKILFAAKKVDSCINYESGSATTRINVKVHRHDQ